MFKVSKDFDNLSILEIDQTMYSGCANTIHAITSHETMKAELIPCVFSAW